MDDLLQDIYLLVKKKMREQGGYDREAYLGFVDETLDYFIEKGKLDPDDNTEFMRTQLAGMWGVMSESLVDDDEPQYNFPV